MNLKKLLFFVLIFTLLGDQIAYSFNAISVEVVEKSEDTSEARIEHFTSQPRQKLPIQSTFRTTPSSAIPGTRSQSLFIAQPTPDVRSRLFLTYRVFRN